MSVLDLPEDASYDDARQAYRDLVKVWHPDRYLDDERVRRRAECKLKEINGAMDLLKEEEEEFRCKRGAKEARQRAATERAARERAAADERRKRKEAEEQRRRTEESARIAADKRRDAEDAAAAYQRQHAAARAGQKAEIPESPRHQRSLWDDPPMVTPGAGPDARAAAERIQARMRTPKSAPGERRARVNAPNSDDQGAPVVSPPTDVSGIVLNWVIRQFWRDHGIDLTADSKAMTRLREAASVAAQEFETKMQTSTRIVLPEITSVDFLEQQPWWRFSSAPRLRKCPLDLDYWLTVWMLKVNPSEVGSAAGGRQSVSEWQMSPGDDPPRDQSRSQSMSPLLKWLIWASLAAAARGVYHGSDHSSNPAGGQTSPITR